MADDAMIESQDKLDKAAKALMMMGPVKHERPAKKPTKADLDRKFKLKLARNGKPVFEEVGQP